MNVPTALDTTSLLPEPFLRWFASRGWTPREHQLELLSKARVGRSVLLIAPTGGGKTLAGFLPSLVELTATPRVGPTLSARLRSTPLPVEVKQPVPLGPRKLLSTGRGIRRESGLHTLYISPLKALAIDIARNLERPVAEMG